MYYYTKEDDYVMELLHKSKVTVQLFYLTIILNKK